MRVRWRSRGGRLCGGSVQRLVCAGKGGGLTDAVDRGDPVERGGDLVEGLDGGGADGECDGGRSDALEQRLEALGGLCVDGEGCAVDKGSLPIEDDQGDGSALRLRESEARGAWVSGAAVSNR